MPSPKGPDNPNIKDEALVTLETSLSVPNPKVGGTKATIEITQWRVVDTIVDRKTPDNKDTYTGNRFQLKNNIFPAAACEHLIYYGVPSKFTVTNTNSGYDPTSFVPISIGDYVELTYHTQYTQNPEPNEGILRLCTGAGSPPGLEEGPYEIWNQSADAISIHGLREEYKSDNQPFGSQLGSTTAIIKLGNAACCLVPNVGTIGECKFGADTDLAAGIVRVPASINTLLGTSGMELDDPNWIDHPEIPGYVIHKIEDSNGNSISHLFGGLQYKGGIELKDVSVCVDPETCAVYVNFSATVFYCNRIDVGDSFCEQFYKCAPQYFDRVQANLDCLCLDCDKISIVDLTVQ